MYKIGDWIPIQGYLQLPLTTPGVYILRNKVNGKEYVGKSIDVRKRMKTHLETKSTRYLYRAFDKHGRENFEMCLYLQGTEEEVTELEGLLIEERKTFAPTGYNMTLGGDGATGWVASEETREKMRNNQLGNKHSEETIAKMKASGGHRKGATMSEEAKAKIGAASSRNNLRRVVSAETREKIRVANTGRKGKPMSEEHKAKLSLLNAGVEKPWLSAKVSGKGNPMFGKPSPNRKRILLVDSTGKETLFNSATEAANHLSVNPASISDWCSGRYKTKLNIAIRYA